MRRPTRTDLRTTVVTLCVGAMALAGCGGDDGASPASTTASTPTTTAPGSATSGGDRGDAAVSILVTNDDGYAADGIDALVNALGTLEDVEVTVVAPLEQQSGSGGRSHSGPLAVSDVTLKSGHPAKAVDGFPADTVRVAMDEMGLDVDLTISGINAGQNLGPIVDVSGTVGAARASVARGVPALAVSSGSGTPEFQYDNAVPLVLEWVEENRSALAAGDAEVEVANLNVPSCDSGEIRGMVEVPSDAKGDPSQALADQDCASTQPVNGDTPEVQAFLNGYATLTEVPDEPLTPAEVVPVDPSTEPTEPPATELPGTTVAPPEATSSTTMTSTTEKATD